MAKKNDGGPVHPQPGYVRSRPIDRDQYAQAGGQGDTLGEYVPTEPGMSLRDYFAGQALVGLLAFPGKYGGEQYDATRAARLAYECADELLAERAKDSPESV